MNRSADTEFDQAVQLFKAGRQAEAEAECLRLLERGDAENPLSLLAAIRLREGDFKDATACYRRIVAINPESPEAHENLGLALGWQRLYPAAIESFQRALVLRPDRAESHVNVGNVHLTLRRYESAIDSYR